MKNYDFYNNRIFLQNRLPSMGTLPQKLSWKPVARFMINCLGGTPVIGGFFGALSAAWSEHEQCRINISLEAKIDDLAQEVTASVSIQGVVPRIEEQNNTLVAIGQSPHWIVAYTKFNSRGEVLGSSCILSITKHSSLDYTVNFAEPLSNSLTFQCFASEPSKLQGVKVNVSKMSVCFRFADRCPELVTVIFLNL